MPFGDILYVMHLLLLLLHLLLAHKLASVCSPPCVMGDKGRVATSQRVSTCSSLPDVQKLAVFETIQT